jgi:hypothetical protein
MARQAIGQTGNLFLGLFLMTAQAPAHIHVDNRTDDSHL